ncbi:MAG TPA: hypothetical protein VI299_19845 [Polyangiales bacterium]
MNYGWLACIALGACVAKESGNPAPRCEVPLDCAPEQACYRGFCIDQDPQSVDPETAADGGALVVDEEDAEPVDAEPTDRGAASDRDAASPDVARPSGDDAALTADAAAEAAVDAAVDAANDVSLDAAGDDAGAPDGGATHPAPPSCLDVCTPPKLDLGMCKKCLEEGVEDLCGEPHKAKGNRCGPRCDDVMCGGKP